MDLFFKVFHRNKSAVADAIKDLRRSRLGEHQTSAPISMERNIFKGEFQRTPGLPKAISTLGNSPPSIFETKNHNSYIEADFGLSMSLDKNRDNGDMVRSNSMGMPVVAQSPQVMEGKNILESKISLLQQELLDKDRMIENLQFKLGLVSTPKYLNTPKYVRLLHENAVRKRSNF